ncbi:MAG TPA: hypothetical protein PLR71_00630 [Deltaproteobacteria bacterium]|mgnify:CR=1 FL=1|nr:hypothetical protein [Deltaproteobacteria bacterium]HQI80036.1 hypothetical protein [Deltaproteobacteria bacterium]
MERIELVNGVLIEVEDKTTHLSGELYMVHLAITFSVALGEDDGELRKYCPGGRLSLTRVLNKPGVHARELSEVKRDLKDSFLHTNLPYMEHPRFVERFKNTSLAKYREAEEKARKAALHEA